MASFFFHRRVISDVQGGVLEGGTALIIFLIVCRGVNHYDVASGVILLHYGPE